ncbi:MAG: phosphoglucosamine mutase, partial [Lachnospiraceae bacterium]|nr:phosphoglucosamine mutase [Lachnospiraceae bacterium]
GVKYFSNKGTKISDELELEIEEIIEGTGLKELTAINDKIGVSETRQDLIEEYVYFFRKTFDEDIEKYNRDDFVVGIDVANGATYEVADKVFNVLGIKHKIINSAPNGVNINDNCGSTHLENIKNYVIENRLSLGIAYDGDGDRCLAIDEFGNEIDGDVMLAIVSSYFKEKRILKNNALVATVMSNLGLSEYAVDTDITLKQTKVGDRYVLEEMQNGGYNLGGEQSGHIIFLDYNPTGDGILTSLMLIKILLEKNISASKAAEIMTIYPQTLVNAKVNSEKKELYKENEKIQKAIREAEEEFNGQGRVLIRPSGTEPLVRVMIEGKDKKQIEQKAKQITEIIEQELS